MTEIKEYKKFYQLVLKGWDTIELTEQAYTLIKPALLDKAWPPFIEIGWSVYNRFEILKVEEKVIDDVVSYILAQPKPMRELIRAYAKSNNIIRTGTDHVSNFIKANSDDKNNSTRETS